MYVNLLPVLLRKEKKLYQTPTKCLIWSLAHNRIYWKRVFQISCLSRHFVLLGEITLVALASLTNIALALRQDPALGEKLKRITVMGGNPQGEHIDQSPYLQAAKDKLKIIS